MRDTNRAAAREWPPHQEEVVANAKLAVARHLRPEGMELGLQIGGGFNALLQIS